MISDLDIYRSANVIMKQYGKDAQIHAAMRGKAGASRFPSDECRFWR